MAGNNTTELAITRPFYFPLARGRYEVKPGLFRFPHDFGNAEQDQLVFQFDKHFSAYQKTKQACRDERLDKYYCTQQLHPDSRKEAIRFIIETLATQNNEQFSHQATAEGYRLECHPSGETLLFDHDYELIDVSNPASITPYHDAFDALACQLQDDLAIVQLNDSDEDTISCLHLCFANHWAAEDKIGSGFIPAHAIVPGMEEINSHADKLLTGLLHKGPYLRFAWGIATDTRLNHHPKAPRGISQQAWQGRQFDPGTPELYLRVERQFLKGFNTSRSILFCIRTYFYDIGMLSTQPDCLDKLINAIESMSDAELDYKGLKADRDVILNWLNKLAA